jgi:PAS domain S-box-containing protein
VLRHADQNDSQGSVRVPSPRVAPTIGTAVEVDPDRQAATAAAVAEAVALALEAAAHQAASLAADELAGSIADGTALDTGRVAELLAATVRAAADAAVQDTTRAAHAVASAAARVTQTVAEVALETDARAAGVALAAREAAAALLSDEHWTRTVDRISDLEKHELATAAREARAHGSAQEMEERLAAAAERERAASLRSFLGDQNQEEYEQHAGGLPGGCATAMDRIDAMTDRATAAAGRAQLSAQLSPGSGGSGYSGGARNSTRPAERRHHLRAPLNSIIASVELEMLEVALRESDDRLRFLVDAVTDYAIISLDPDGIIESWNTGAERIKGYTPEEALGRHFSTFYPAEDCDSGLPQRLLDRARAEGSCERTGWRVRKDGSQFWGDIVISAVHNDTGILTGFVKVVRDLTEQHRLEVAQDSFYNAFEHDFRVPITAIKGFAELLAEADPEYQGYLAERVDSNANRLLSMVEELVDYARLRSGLVPISLQSVDLVALAELAAANLASIRENPRVHVTADTSVNVLADPAALERVIANLVTNALKYSPTESEIHLICERVEDAGVLRIVDQGRGIDERDLGSIFLEFERGRLAQDDSGTGLGLASVQRLIGLQDGTVAITSQIDVGTTVTIQLPLAP